jgi:ABC-type bacteriocin/lantibiotic exporter with double-glycine peptidase domain
MKISGNRYFGWLYKRTGGARAFILMLIFTTIVVSVAQISISYIMMEFVNIATGVSHTAYSHVVWAAIGIILIWGIFHIFNTLLKSAIYGKIEGSLRCEFLHSAFTRRFTDIQKVHSGEQMTLLSNDTAAVSQFFPDMISGIFGNIVLVVISVVSLFVLNWKIAVVLMIVSPILIVVLNLFAPEIQKLSMINKTDEENNRKFLHDRVSKLLLFKSYSMTDKSVADCKDNYRNKYRSSLKLSFAEGMSLFMNILFGMSMFLIILGIGSYLAMKGEVTFGKLIAMLQLMNTVINPFSAVSQYISKIAQSRASVERLRSVMDLPREQLRVSDLSMNPVKLIAKNVSFSYGEAQVLNDVSIEATRGEIVGIIGESGSGKSTLAKLLMGLYEPTEGKVQSVADTGAEIHDILAFVSYVPADGFLFTGSVCENICMDKTADDALLKSACEAANILDFVKSLPNGFDEIIGEGSNNLSSGQAQRISIARAIYRDSPIIIFDEPTSNLDVDAIDSLRETIRRAAGSKICLIITHDTGTAEICDKVYVMKDGKVSA